MAFFAAQARPERGGDDGFGVQVGLACRRRPDGLRLVREAHVPRVAIGIRIKGDRVDAEAVLAGSGRGDWRGACAILAPEGRGTQSPVVPSGP